jgi:hypothetical protein
VSEQNRVIAGTVGVLALLAGFVFYLIDVTQIALFLLITGTVLSTVSIHTGKRVYIKDQQRRGSHRWW